MGLALLGCGSDSSHPKNLSFGSGGSTPLGGSGGGGNLSGAGGSSGGAGAGGTNPFASCSSSDCNSGNVLVFDGQKGDYIHPSDDVVTEGAWSGSVTADLIEVKVDPTNEKQGLWWNVRLSSEKLGAPLAPGAYPAAQRWPFEDDGHPGLDVSGDGRGCNQLSGSFEIVTLDAQGCGITATFVQSCETTMPPLKGCVHFKP